MQLRELKKEEIFEESNFFESEKCVKNKNPYSIFLIFALCMSLFAIRASFIYMPVIEADNFISNTYLVRKEDIEKDNEDDEEDAVWNVSDFNFEEKKIIGTEDSDGNPDVEYCINGFSELGKKKIKKIKKLILPFEGTNGKKPVWISEGAFSDMEIDEVEIPGNYTHIQFRAFKNCSIKKLILKEGVVFINKFAFMDNSIEEVEFPSTLKYTAEAAFKNNKLKSLVFPEKMESIGIEAFMNNRIEDISFKGKLKHIHHRAFKNNLLTQIQIPKTIRNYSEGIEGIYKTAFDDNPGVKNPKDETDSKVLLWTPRKNNPFDLVSKGNFLIDPKDWLS